MTRRSSLGAVSAMVSSLAMLALTAACGVVPAGVETQQSRAMATVVAGLQAQLSSTPVTVARAQTTPPGVAAPAIQAPSILGTSLAQALAAAPARAGQPMAITTEAGEHLTVTVNAIIDPAQSTNKYNQPKGRFVVIDWTLRNDGSIGHVVSIYEFKLQTADGFLYDRGMSAGLPQPDVISGTVAEGQTVRGYVSYDVPAGAVLKSAIYQPLGNRQFVIADLAP
jgi:hypothetical protein